MRIGTVPRWQTDSLSVPSTRQAWTCACNGASQGVAATEPADSTFHAVHRAVGTLICIALALLDFVSLLFMTMTTPKTTPNDDDKQQFLVVDGKSATKLVVELSRCKVILQEKQSKARSEGLNEGDVLDIYYAIVPSEPGNLLLQMNAVYVRSKDEFYEWIDGMIKDLNDKIRKLSVAAFCDYLLKAMEEDEDDDGDDDAENNDTGSSPSLLQAA